MSGLSRTHKKRFIKFSGNASGNMEFEIFDTEKCKYGDKVGSFHFGKNTITFEEDKIIIENGVYCKKHSDCRGLGANKKTMTITPIEGQEPSFYLLKSAIVSMSGNEARVKSKSSSSGESFQQLHAPGKLYPEFNLH